MRKNPKAINFLNDESFLLVDIPSFFLRRNAHLKRSWRDETRKRRAVTPNKPVPTAKEKGNPLKISKELICPINLV